MSTNGPLTPLIENLKTLKGYMENALDAAVNKHLNDISDLQRDRLKEGINSDGQPLERVDGYYYPYSPGYKSYKRARGGRVDVVDLKLTGAYHRSIKTVKNGKNKALTYNTNSKDKELQMHYKGIEGIAPEQEKDLHEMFKPDIMQALKTKITNKKIV